MAYIYKFQALADATQKHVASVPPQEVEALLQSGAVISDIRDKEEHVAGHIPGFLHISRGTRERNVAAALPDFDLTILCFCHLSSSRKIGQ